MGILGTIAIILLVIWLGGWALDILGSFIHVILVIAIALFVGNFLKSRKA